MRSVYINVCTNMVLYSTFFSVQVIFCYKNLILHRQTVYRLTEKVMPFKNKCEKIQIKKFQMKYLLIFTVHAPFHPPNLFSSWNRASKNIVNALNVVIFAHLWEESNVCSGILSGRESCWVHGGLRPPCGSLTHSWAWIFSSFMCTVLRKPPGLTKTRASLSSLYSELWFPFCHSSSLSPTKNSQVWCLSKHFNRNCNLLLLTEKLDIVYMRN